MGRGTRWLKGLVGGLTIVVLGQFSAQPLFAQENAGMIASEGMLVSLATATEIVAAPALGLPRLAETDSNVATLAKPVVRPASSGALIPFYVSTAALQILDVHSTMRALGNGAREANPMMSSVAGNPYALVAVKAAVTAGAVYAIHRVAKRNRVGAMVAMVAVNSAYAAVVAHNYHVARAR